MIDTILLILAAICFALDAFGVLVGRINLLAAGLLCWVLAALLPL